VVDAERRGEVLAAADLAERGLEEHPDDVALRYHSVLALARAGSTAQAASRFAAYRLGDLDVLSPVLHQLLRQVAHLALDRLRVTAHPKDDHVCRRQSGSTCSAGPQEVDRQRRQR